MTVTHAILTYSTAAALLTMAPGLDTALVLRTAAVEGRGRALWAGAGICIGCLTWGLAASVGLGAILTASHAAYRTLRLLGSVYLVYLGATMIARSRGLDAAASGQAGFAAPAPWASTHWFTRGFLTNLLNPKVGAFYVTFLPQFIPAGSPIVRFSMLLALIHAAEGMIWFVILTRATDALARWSRRPSVVAALDRITGTVLIGFGIGLAIERRG
ncbi:MAG TPA: LysE family translocator [Gemmatimonadaceae bacterium]|nr:LysE family translocator [Gemmatimonadaceae bacterium]